MSNAGLDRSLVRGDCLDVMNGLESNSVDMVFCSPPYEDARLYGIDFDLKGPQWVTWAANRFVAACHVSRGLVAFVVNGRTKNFAWTATPALLMAEIVRRGVNLRKPPIFHRSGIPGSGGPDWFRDDYEFVICASKGRLPWSDNTAMGAPLKYDRGGNFSHHDKHGRIANQGQYPKVKIANPGNVIKGKVGGGHMGHPLAHKTEAAFPVWLAEFFVRSCCPPGGIVLDPFCGSGTTLHAAQLHGRGWMGIDIRQSQIDLAWERMQALDEGLVQCWDS